MCARVFAKVHILKMELYFLVIFISLMSPSLELSDGWDAVDQLSFNLMRDENFKTHNTELFRRRPGLSVRHDLDFRLALQWHKQCDEPFIFKLMENDKSILTWTETPLVKDGVLHFNLHVNRSIPVGQYTLNTRDPCSEERKPICLGNVNVMFNPWSAQWNKESKRFRRQPTNDLMNEYTNNNFGFIWIASTGIPWNYAVGSEVVTNAKNDLMAMLPESTRSDEVLYSRALTELIHLHVLLGRWDGMYGDGVEPTRWVGSEDILSLWLMNKQQVRYGQCWVFAAILTTILRASGIPARTVTNYRSHHDRGLTDDETAVLRQYDNIVQPDESQWNFHVWTEAWLQRDDLGEPFNWNALDATPQEPSPLAPNQPYRTGPAYVPYIRSNITNANYDTLFILAEVNAAEICRITGRPLPSAVGYAVVTKKPGQQQEVYDYSNPDDITTNYKISSGSKRSTRASENLILPPPYIGCERDGGMRISSTPPSPRVGENFMLSVTEGNVSVEDTIIRMELWNYMGESLGIIAIFTGMKERDVIESDYLPYLGNSSIFRFSVGTYNESGGFIFHDAIRIRLEYGKLQVQATKVSGSTTITVTVTYTNPLSIPMTGVELSVSSPNSTYIRQEQPDIPANTQFMVTVEVECSDDNDDNVMIPISLDSDVTQSIYGIGFSNCREAENGGGTASPGFSVLQIMLISLLVLSMFI